MDDDNIIVFEGADFEVDDSPEITVEKLKTDLDDKNKLIEHLNERNAVVSSVNELLRIQLMDIINHIQSLQNSLSSIMNNIKVLQSKLPNTTPEVRLIK